MGLCRPIVGNIQGVIFTGEELLVLLVVERVNRPGNKCHCFVATEDSVGQFWDMPRSSGHSSDRHRSQDAILLPLGNLLADGLLLFGIAVDAVFDAKRLDDEGITRLEVVGLVRVGAVGHRNLTVAILTLDRVDGSGVELEKHWCLF